MTAGLELGKQVNRASQGRRRSQESRLSSLYIEFKRACSPITTRLGFMLRSLCGRRRWKHVP